MVEVRPFKAIRYTALAGNPESLITQPYDKIDDDMQREYYAKSPYNFCRLILPLEANKYEIAAKRVKDWIHQDVMEKDSKPAFFVCRQEFNLNGRKCVRTGVMVALRLYDYSENVVFPHEITYSAPKTDRLNMLRTVQKDLEPVFLMYSDPDRVTATLFAEVTKNEPIVVVQDPFGAIHTVWRVSDSDKIRLLQKALERQTVVITDGHHRYESAIAYRDAKRKEKKWDPNSAFNFHMSLLVPVEDEGLVVLSTHRLLRNFDLTTDGLNALKKIFSVTEIQANVQGLNAFLNAHKNEHAFAIYTKGKAYGLNLKHKDSIYEFVKAKSSKETKVYDVVILHDVIFKAILKTGDLELDEDILYERWTKAAVEKVDEGEAKTAFLMNPIGAKTVWEIAHQHERMPEKTTDFYPKPASGLLMMDIADGEKL